MTLRSSSSWFAVALALVVVPSAAADAVKPTPGSAAAQQRAAEQYQRGITRYNLGEFDAAVVEFKAAYELSQEPDLLFNIAQAYRLGDDYKQALFFYDAYLRLRPDAANRTDVEARIAATRKLLEDQQRLQQSPPQDAIPLAVVTGEPRKNESPIPSGEPNPVGSGGAASLPNDPTQSRGIRPGRQLVTAGVIVGGAGVLIGATGAYFALRARGSWNEISALSRAEGTWNDHYAGVEASAVQSERVAAVLVVTGGAAAITGGVLWYLGWRDKHRREEIVVTPIRGGARASVTWRF